MTIAFLSWYFLYVLMCAFARDFMDTKLFGNINVALMFGLLQFVSTFTIAIAYSRYANSKMDPLADEPARRARGRHRMSAASAVLALPRRPRTTPVTRP